MNTLSVITLMPQLETETKAFVEKTKALVEAKEISVSKLLQYLKHPTQAIRELNLWLIEKEIENF